MRGASIIVVAAAVQAAPLVAQNSSTTEELRRCFDRQIALASFSGVALVRGKDRDFVRTAGFMDQKRKTPIAPDTRFRLASVQKVLTKTAIGLLIEQARVKFDDPVGKYVAGLPEHLAAATIQQLLDHRSGAASLTRLTPEVESRLQSARTTSDLVSLVATQPTSFPPGERQEYSNGGYYLLGGVIEKVSGKSYRDFLEQQIFKPVGMTSTSLEADSRTATPLSKMQFGPLERRATSAGDGVSTAGDLAKLGAALAGDKLLSRSTTERLFPRRGDVWRIGQGGGTMGTNTDLAAFPENGWVIVVLSNFDPPAGELMAEALRGVVLGKGCTPLSEKDRPSRLRMRPPSS